MVMDSMQAGVLLVIGVTIELTVTREESVMVAKAESGSFSIF
jgi:hypothetical protein